MGSFGERLRREREMRGITIEEIAEATKIGSRNLRALEDENFAQLPGGIFNKGFVRAYSKYLGLDEEQAVADYIAAESAMSGDIAEEQSAEQQESASSSVIVPVILAMVIVLAAVGFGGWKYYGKLKAQRTAESAAAVQPQASAASSARAQSPAEQPSTAAPQPSSAAPDASAAAAPAGTPGAPTSATPAPVTNPSSTAPATPPSGNSPAGDNSVHTGDIVVQVKATESSWISANADGKSVFSGTLKTPDERTIHARERMVLTLGNAGGVQITYNGKPLAMKNAAGQVRKLVFTPQGLEPDAPEQR